MRPITDPGKKEKILEAYFNYYNAYSGRKWENMLFALADGFTMFGTGVDELCNSPEKAFDVLKREFKQAPSSVKYDIKSLNVYEVSDDVVLLMVVKDMHVTGQRQKFCFTGNRASIIMKKKGDEWKVAHGHWSMPDKDIAEGESVPYSLLMERSRELEEKVAQRTKQIEEQKKQLQNLNKTKDKLFSIIAHDLRNPFNSILGFSEMLYRNIGIYDHDKMRELLENVYNQASATYELLENLLNWARSQTDMITFSPREQELVPVVKQITSHMEVMAENKGIELKNNVESGFKVYADRNLLQIILRNLIHNALKFSYNGGSVEITSERAADGVKVSVLDKGSGIDKDVIDRLRNGITMDTVSGTANEVGTGLGLILCREFIGKHGGTLDIESTPGKGSCFSFTFPDKAE